MTYDVLTFLGSILIGSTALVGLAVFLGKALLNALLSRDLERFKSELRRIAFEHETRFAKLHEKRAEVIAELYKRLVVVNRIMGQVMSPLQIGPGPSDKAINETSDSGNAFLEYYLQNRIYFDESICKKMDSLHAKFWSAWVDYLMYPKDGPDAKLRQDSLFRAWKTVSEEVPPILQDIEKAFRGLLGHGDIRARNH